MDSAGNEVIIVDDRAQTNGFNGNYSEEVIAAAAAAAAAAASSEMKTRSKAVSNTGGPGEAAKLRSRAAANVANSHNDKAPASPATVISASNVSTSASSSSSSSDKDKKMNLRSGVTDSQADSGYSKASALDSAAASGSKKSTGVEGTPGPKSSKKGAGSVGDREDDSGINSRSSSVSTDDTYSSRLRTRSKRAEALSSSTPASTKKASLRMPLSTYDFDDDSMILQIEEDSSSSGSSLKRKATKVVVEEMEEEEPAAGSTAEDDDEPPVKITVRRTSFFDVLLNPLKAFRGKIFSGTQLEEQDEKPAADNEDAAQTNGSKVNDEACNTEHAASQTGHHNTEASTATTATNEDGKETPSTCMIM